jgi:hypothetical protein
MTLRILIAALWAMLAGAAGAAGFQPLDVARAQGLLRQPGPAVITLWSVDCSHCKKNLDLFAALRGRLPGVALHTILTDPPEDLQTAWPVLAGRGLTEGAWAYGEETDERLRHAIDPAWRGELPRSYILDGRGGRQAVSGVLDEATLRRALGLR